VAELAPAAVSFVVRFVGDREMRRLCRRYRNLGETTDVLSFPGSEESHRECPPRRRTGHLGDVVISVPEARRQAALRGHEAERELRILALHGLLHCLGYDHETDDGTMERLETRLRRRWIGRPRTEEGVGA
jgi:probable rRNA maturation factor